MYLVFRENRVKGIRISCENKYMLLTFLLSTLNVFTFDIQEIALFLAIVETAIVIYFLLTLNINNFLTSYILFSSTTIESSLFTLGTHSAGLYSFFHLPILSYYHLFFLVFIAYFVNLYKNRKMIFNIKTLSGKIVIIFLVGCLATAVTILLNDNNINNISGMYRFIIIDAYNALWLMFLLALLWDIIKYNEGFRGNIEQLIYGILCGVVLAGIVSLLFKQVYVKNEMASFLIAPLILFFSPGLILFYFKKERGIKYLILGMVSLLLQVKYSVGIPGAWWLYVALILFTFLLRIFGNVFNNSKRFKSVSVIMILMAVLLMFVPQIIQLFFKGLNDSSSYIAYKFSTLVNLLHVSNGSSLWYDSLGNSIGVRVDAIVNCFIEIVKNPVYFLIGKGYGGSIQKNWGVYNWDIPGATYPDVQIDSGVYSSFHTGIAELIINFGLIGIILLVILCRDMIKSIFKKKENGWIIIGVFWLFVFLYFYHSMFLGALILAYGLYLYKEEKIIS